MIDDNLLFLLLQKQLNTMKPSKLQTSLAQLQKIQNQIRVQLNLVRPSRQPYFPEKPTRTPKKIFYQRINTTTIFGPPKTAFAKDKSATKRMFQKQRIFNTDQNKQTERKHFDQNFTHKVELNLSINRTKSSYLRPKTQMASKSISPIKQAYNTSLQGIGIKDKSNNTRNKSGKRIVPSYHIYKGDMI